MLTIAPKSGMLAGDVPVRWEVRYGPHAHTCYVGINSPAECPLAAIAALLAVLTYRAPSRLTLKAAKAAGGTPCP